jgi:hypothetical protein
MPAAKPARPTTPCVTSSNRNFFILDSSPDFCSAANQRAGSGHLSKTRPSIGAEYFGVRRFAPW